MKRYFLTDNSGAPLKIESLGIAHEEINHAWTYDTQQQLIKVFNEKAEVLNYGHKQVSLPKLLGWALLLTLSFLGAEDIFRALSG